MIPVKDTARVARKYKDRATAADTTYREGVAAPLRSWKNNTRAAIPAYTEGIQKALAEKRYDNAIAAATDDTWREGAMSKGADRYGPGILMGEQKYQAKIDKVLNVIKAVELPPPGRKGDPKNYLRSQAVGMALNKAKVEGRLR